MLVVYQVCGKVRLACVSSTLHFVCLPLRLNLFFRLTSSEFKSFVEAWLVCDSLNLMHGRRHLLDVGTAQCSAYLTFSIRNVDPSKTCGSVAWFVGLIGFLGINVTGFCPCHFGSTSQQLWSGHRKFTVGCQPVVIKFRVRRLHIKDSFSLITCPCVAFQLLDGVGWMSQPWRPKIS